LNNLPEEILREILSYVSVEDILMNAVCVCQRFARIIESKIPFKSITINKKSPTQVENILEVVAWAGVKELIIKEQTVASHPQYQRILSCTAKETATLSSLSVKLSSADLVDHSAIADLVKGNASLKKLLLSFKGKLQLGQFKVHANVQQLELWTVKLTPYSSDALFTLFPSLTNFQEHDVIEEPGFWKTPASTKYQQIVNLHVKSFPLEIIDQMAELKHVQSLSITTALNGGSLEKFMKNVHHLESLSSLSFAVENPPPQ
jgi:hypothetical protein